ncbi:endonuclease 2 isoform X2 [Solanum verrucosum]|uniref:endonuclease 2 isoform X2 n=1 Tax=Solanum verrucosum TaxID=315347 RepID=UPI0020D08157|nr:endonuclease 2 isoform X2 [Solanum verrucosum]
MELYKFHVFLAMVAVLFLFPVVHGWGLDGHYTVCKIAQSRLSKAAADAVEKLLPTSANGDLASVCIWADRVKFHYHWSSPLHYIDTPDNLCNYQYKRDCKDEDGVEDRCVAGAIYNYTNQLLSYNKGNGHVSTYNLTEALLFLSHFFGDIHQVWDSNIIETVEERYDDSNVDELVDAIQKNITTGWADQVNSWESCSGNKTACPDIYASEGIKAACDWAYKGVSEDSTLEDDYFLSRYPIVQWRLAQGGVRLAATLNRIFK